MNWQNLTNKQKIYLITFLGVIIVLLWSFFSSKMLTSGLSRKDISSGGDSQQAIVEGIILTETKDDVKYWEIYGDTGTYDSKQEIATLDGVLANFYKGNNVTMSIKSSHGTYNAKEKTITLCDDTYLVIQDGLTLSADKLIWSGNDNPIFAYGNVTITKDDQFMAHADEIEISADYENVKIKGNTTSKIYGSGNEK